VPAPSAQGTSGAEKAAETAQGTPSAEEASKAAQGNLGVQKAPDVVQVPTNTATTTSSIETAQKAATIASGNTEVATTAAAIGSAPVTNLASTPELDELYAILRNEVDDSSLEQMLVAGTCLVSWYEELHRNTVASAEDAQHAIGKLSGEPDGTFLNEAFIEYFEKVLKCHNQAQNQASLSAKDITTLSKKMTLHFSKWLTRVDGRLAYLRDSAKETGTRTAIEKRRKGEAKEIVDYTDKPGGSPKQEESGFENDKSMKSPPSSLGSPSSNQEPSKAINDQDGSAHDSAENARKAHTQGTKRKAEDIEGAAAQVKAQNATNAQ
jgi:hypothetical protein